MIITIAVNTIEYIIPKTIIAPPSRKELIIMPNKPKQQIPRTIPRATFAQRPKNQIKSKDKTDVRMPHPIVFL